MFKSIKKFFAIEDPQRRDEVKGTAAAVGIAVVGSAIAYGVIRLIASDE